MATKEQNDFRDLRVEYNNKLGDVLNRLFREKEISHQRICNVFARKYNINLNSGAVSKWFSNGKDNIPAIVLKEACDLLGISLCELFNYVDQDAGKQSQVISARNSDKTMYIPIPLSDALIVSPDNLAFRGYLGKYYTYFTPTHSSDSDVLKGTLTFTGSENMTLAHFELETSQKKEDGSPVYKTYDGVLICSKAVSTCYCILSSVEIGEMGFIMFRHFQLNNQEMECRVATAMTTSAGSDDRNPVVHRMLLSKEELHDEDVLGVMPLLLLNSAEITISKESWDEIADSNTEFSEASKLLRIGYELKELHCYQIRENTIRTIFKDSPQLENMSSIPFIVAARSKSISYRYNKVSRKSDTTVRDFLRKRGYFQKKK